MGGGILSSLVSKSEIGKLKKFLLFIFGKWDAKFAVGRENLLKESPVFHKSNDKFLAEFLEVYDEIPRIISDYLIAYNLAGKYCIRKKPEILEDVADQKLKARAIKKLRSTFGIAIPRKEIDKEVDGTFKIYKKFVDLLVSIPLK